MSDIELRRKTTTSAVQGEGQPSSSVDLFIEDLRTVVGVIGRRPRMQAVYSFHDAQFSACSAVNIDKPIRAYYGLLSSSFDGAERVPLLERLIRDEDKMLFEVQPGEMIEEMVRRGAMYFGDGQYAYRIPGNPVRNWEAAFQKGQRQVLSVPTTVSGVQYLFAADRIENEIQFQESLHIRGLFVPR